jgi:glycosyltransferase involved in cell wall biosynthesis
MGLFFYPRGGSAQVVRYLSSALAKEGWETDLATGSLGEPGATTHAGTFFGRRDLIVADYTDAALRYSRGHDPMAAPVPHHPSFEDRPDMPDRVIASLDDTAARRQVTAWTGLLARSAWQNDAVLHIHHLTPLQPAAERCFPDTPQVTHLHGTELKFIAKAVSDPPAGWEQAAAWVERLRRAAAKSAHIICVSPHDRSLAVDLLGVDSAPMTVIPNGVDTDLFDSRELDLRSRLGHWRRWLVEDPQGWDESATPGSIRYVEQDLGVFVDGGAPSTVLLFVGRFLGFKRLALLVRAYGRARHEFGVRAPLVIWGGSPGEWEGEHPYTVARDEGIEGVFFVGWRGHEELPTALACSDVLVAPSVDEPFGLVYLEAMACGLPVIATTTGGPLSFVNTHSDEPNGWLVPPDDEGALAAALAEASGNPQEVRSRGHRAYEQIRAAYSWRSLARRFISVYEDVI